MFVQDFQGPTKKAPFSANVCNVCKISVDLCISYWCW